MTYFFNGGVEPEWEGETRILVPSPRDVPSYDLKPEMSAREVAARFAAEIGHGYRFAVINFANPDMVGHTGSIPAVTKAIEVTDECLAVVVEATHAAGGVCLVTADHGNAEQMLEADGVSPHTAHTTNPVPLVRHVPRLRARGARRARRSSAHDPAAPGPGCTGRNDGKQSVHTCRILTYGFPSPTLYSGPLVAAPA